MAILYGTQSNGETLPVLVDQFGNLLAKGIEGQQGPQGPQGPPGVGELPPGATDGALLGWQDGELVWVTEPVPIVPAFLPLIYSGNSGTQSIYCGFSPALIWTKSRNNPSDHKLVDTVRGLTNVLEANLESSASTDITNGVTAVSSTGFSLGNNGDFNSDSGTYVAWCWDAGETTVNNNDGSIQSQVRSNGSFSVVTYTGLGGNQSFGHGLDFPAEFVIIKQIFADSYWLVGHKELFNADGYLRLNDSTATEYGAGYVWQSSAPTSTVVSLGDSTVNANGIQYIAYCWAGTPGTSFSQYSGTGGRQTIEIGFRPSLVMIKSTVNGNWFMFDNARGAGNALYANLSDIEGETGAIQFEENGFQILYGLPGINENNVTYIYAGFANPIDASIARTKRRREARREKRQQNKTRLR